MQIQLLILTLLTTLAMAQTRPLPVRTWIGPDHTEPAHVHYRTFQSKLTGGELSYLIYLRPDYDSDTSKRYPVVHWLHGYGGHPRSGAAFSTPLDSGIRAGQAIVVLVNVLEASFRCDSLDGKWRVESVRVHAGDEIQVAHCIEPWVYRLGSDRAEGRRQADRLARRGADRLEAGCQLDAGRRPVDGDRSDAAFQRIVEGEPAAIGGVA